MTGFSRGARAGIAAGLLIAAAATIGATADDHMPAQRAPAPGAPHLVEYGGRCYGGYCVPAVPAIPAPPAVPAPPCNSVQSCRNKLPPGLR
ncbi:hypothetical protein A9W99_05565 [Mycobacterium sp. 1164966.3]|uniref:hypothetical protein n=1 Tax=unclassified Mycobacterium TaxID=2642494 RepID=UPI0007FC4CBC|nr:MULTISPECIES: hypothetical protein [unclassified Mycobacterium]OBA83877.1 hypothetical protein A9W99_05565 [Mycobacterium sp. 1164966.3]OBF82648.1 hypothetical protein A5791_04230 [Mycobacterium sp. 852002-51163_SCH5372311]